MTTQIAQLANVQLSNALSIVTNADFRGQITLAAGVDLSGILFGMQIRTAVGAADVIADLNSGNGALFGDTTGVLHYLLTAQQTKFLAPFSGGSAVADILAGADGVTLNLCQTPLAVAISAGVTAPFAVASTASGASGSPVSSGAYSLSFNPINAIAAAALY